MPDIDGHPHAGVLGEPGEILEGVHPPEKERPALGEPGEFHVQRKLEQPRGLRRVPRGYLQTRFGQWRRQRIRERVPADTPDPQVLDHPPEAVPGGELVGELCYRCAVVAFGRPHVELGLMKCPAAARGYRLEVVVVRPDVVRCPDEGTRPGLEGQSRVTEVAAVTTEKGPHPWRDVTAVGCLHEPDAAPAEVPSAPRHVDEMPREPAAGLGHHQLERVDANQLLVVHEELHGRFELFWCLVEGVAHDAQPQDDPRGGEVVNDPLVVGRPHAPVQPVEQALRGSFVACGENRASGLGQAAAEGRVGEAGFEPAAGAEADLDAAGAHLAHRPDDQPQVRVLVHDAKELSARAADHGLHRIGDLSDRSLLVAAGNQRPVPATH